ncbi:SAM-dependent methyltransferase [Streptomyces lunaelactis]|uniref:SAM-dependent methyltransferase n=1 Tax=Streptomyces lunaelactis TaxID=1535768 RepID=A0A2R4SVK8_9ACTN|nr:methyltransferase [Streptomyces lunaelactis]AVZ70898.1 SAM-dependent methyltransferase [Streptomyces lunaelactis]NUK26909.1 methyltransferase [Streptomyces lunaelactis]NUK85634.1 methyltransferase [Streptomyces lunaelactis]
MKVTDEVMQILDRSQTKDSALFLPSEQLGRSTYLAVNQVLAAAGGTWNRKARAHLFPGDAAEAIEPILMTGEVVRAQDFGYFPTPTPVVEEMLSLAELEAGHLVLEPSAGRGAIAHRVAEFCSVNCIELLEENAKALTAAGLVRSVEVGDFLEIDPEPRYDRVLMNPPFAKQADIAHVRHALKFLRPGGLLVSVMSAGVTFRSNRATADFRDLVDELGGTITRLPDDAFKESGTGVRTVLVAIVV